MHESNTWYMMHAYSYVELYMLETRKCTEWINIQAIPSLMGQIVPPKRIVLPGEASLDMQYHMFKVLKLNIIIWRTHD